MCLDVVAYLCKGLSSGMSRLDVKDLQWTDDVVRCAAVVRAVYSICSTTSCGESWLIELQDTPEAHGSLLNESMS